MINKNEAPEGYLAIEDFAEADEHCTDCSFKGSLKCTGLGSGGVSCVSYNRVDKTPVFFVPDMGVPVTISQRAMRSYMWGFLGDEDKYNAELLSDFIDYCFNG